MKTIEIQPFLDSLDFLEKKEKALTEVYEEAVELKKSIELFNHQSVYKVSYDKLSKALKRARKYVSNKS